LWDDLVSLVEHYCRPGDVLVDEFGVPLPGGPVRKGTDASADVGYALGLKFANRLELEGFPHSDFTYNLHLVVCR
jgi:hypothetical protein